MGPYECSPKSLIIAEHPHPQFGEWLLLIFSQVGLLLWGTSSCFVYQALGYALLPAHHPKVATPIPDKELDGSHLNQRFGITQWSKLTICCWLWHCSQKLICLLSQRGISNLVLSVSWVFQTKILFTLLSRVCCCLFPCLFPPTPSLHLPTLSHRK